MAQSTAPTWAVDGPESSTAAQKAKAQGGTWQTLGMSSWPSCANETGITPAMARSLLLRGFKTPTPIQRAAIPSAVNSPPRDLLGMARTGSGKTLAYLIPMLQRLGGKHAKVFGPRALVICPNRELAMQILRVGKDLARGYMEDKSDKGEALRWAVIMGGEGLDEQFGAVASNPDMLFEMGFESQLREILHRLPPNRQNLLFSATLPSSLADFAKAGLVNPILIRLDTEQKINPDLSMAFFYIKPTEKDAALLVLLKDVIKVPVAQQVDLDRRSQAIIFVSTKHHVEYLCTLLQTAGYSTAQIYGSLDQVARQQQMQSFRSGNSDLLVVTDVAARGLDIPIMENVVNYDFPTGARVFVHRVGRTARAGRKGSAWSLVTRDDVPYLIDLGTFLGKSFLDDPERSMGTVPRDSLDAEIEYVFTGLDESAPQLRVLREVMRKGQSMFIRSRGKASQAAYRDAKTFNKLGDGDSGLTVHPAFEAMDDAEQQIARSMLLAAVKSYNPHETVFEVGSRGQTPGAILMKQRRKTIGKRKPTVNELAPSRDVSQEIGFTVHAKHENTRLQAATKSFKDPEFFLSHTQDGAEGEKGYSLRDGATFTEQVRSATFDMTGDEGAAQKAQKASQLSWDRKKKKFVKGEGIGADNQKMLKTESGALLPATFKSGRFDEWRRKQKLHLPRSGDTELSFRQTPRVSGHRAGPPKAGPAADSVAATPSDRIPRKIDTQRRKLELKSSTAIRKTRQQAEQVSPLHSQSAF
ncbi:ATP-dependent RNA helicase DDX54/DBP10, partial [Tremellales sp. Uapishka_1]